MSIWKKEPDADWLIDLHQHISTPISCSGNIGVKFGSLWKGPYYSDDGEDAK